MDYIEITETCLLKDALNLMSKNNKIFGMAVVVDDQKKFKGVLTLGDLTKAISNNVSIENLVKDSYNKNSIFYEDPISDKEIIDDLLSKINQKFIKRIPRYVPIIVKDKVDRLFNTYEYLLNNHETKGTVCILGLGFVGLTLALSLSKKSKLVIGYDIDKNLVQSLAQGKSHVNEPRINSLLKENLENKKLVITNDISKEVDINQFIICVGTPIKKDNMPNNKPLESCLNFLGNKLKKGNLVIVRSTVSIGTTRNIIIPQLEKISKLKAGKDFFISFSPERTVQGDALFELENLPQLVSGYTDKCLLESLKFWRKVNNSVIKLDSLEAAEIAKLANNTYRDLTFAFANGLSQICDSYQIDARSLISLINEGYERSNIPQPSPGVGGYCLSKDPYILSSSKSCPNYFRDLIDKSRKTNDLQIKFLIQSLNYFVKNKNLDISKLNILIIGIAFKGKPITNDIRFSPSIDLLNELKIHNSNIYGFDSALEQDIKIDGLNIIHNSVEFYERIKVSNAIFIMNNNENNIPEEFFENISPGSFISDPWHMFRESDIATLKKVTYSTLGRIINL